MRRLKTRKRMGKRKKRKEDEEDERRRDKKFTRTQLEG